MGNPCWVCGKQDRGRSACICTQRSGWNYLICCTQQIRLKAANVTPRDFERRATNEPDVLAWMPAASIYFDDPDGNQLEFIAMLPDAPRPELGVLRWSEWKKL